MNKIEHKHIPNCILLSCVCDGVTEKNASPTTLILAYKWKYCKFNGAKNSSREGFSQTIMGCIEKFRILIDCVGD